MEESIENVTSVFTELIKTLEMESFKLVKKGDMKGAAKIDARRMDIVKLYTEVKASSNLAYKESMVKIHSLELRKLVKTKELKNQNQSLNL